MNTNERDETLSINGTPYVGLSTYAKTNGMDVKHLRRYVRNPDNVAPVRKFNRVWLIERDATIELPVTKSRGSSRTDGRQRFVVYMSAIEHDAMLDANIVPSDCVVNPRDAARERRANAATATE